MLIHLQGRKRPQEDSLPTTDRKNGKVFPGLQLQGGHINDTFLVEDGAKYTLQRINPYVFPSPKNIMENITGVTSFLREKILQRGGDPQRETLNICRTTSGDTLFIDHDGQPWRCGFLTV